MDTGIGAKLRDARKRRKVGLSEAEDATKIRAQLLQAMEEEDWDSLPGGSYTRNFIRTYASFLGLDGQKLAEDYRLAAGEPAPGERGSPKADPVVASTARGATPRGRLIALVAVMLVAVAAVAAVGLSSGEGDGSSDGPRDSGSAMGKRTDLPSEPAAEAPRSGVSIRLRANAEVWVCLLAADGQELVDGEVLSDGVEEGPFHSGSFTISLGNGEASMWIDGEQADIPETSSPIGYEIDERGELTPLEEQERPTCV